MVDLLKAADDDDESDDDDDNEMPSCSSLDNAAILRYQDPIGNMSSALHFAVANQKVEVVWLLLLLASNLGPENFPPEVRAAAESLQISRQDQSGKADIRLLQDSDGKIAAQHANPKFSSTFDVSLLAQH